MQGSLRLYSALVMLTFVCCHLVNHALALASLGWANAGRAVLIHPWNSDAGVVVLWGAALTHYLNALWSVYNRRAWRLARWEAWQLGLGLCIPLLLMLHVMATRIADAYLKITPDYYYVFSMQWVLLPWSGWLQAVTLLIVWTHACIGVRFWLGVKAGYPRWRPWLAAAAVALPTLALAGVVSGSFQLLRLADKDGFVQDVLDDANASEQAEAEIMRLAGWGIAVHGLLTLAPFVGRAARRRLLAHSQQARLSYPGVRPLPIAPGATMLETLHEHGVAHAAVCGGRGRCTTCRVLVADGMEALPAPSPVEAHALARIHAPPRTRLACQVRPTADVSARPLLPAAADAADGFTPGGLEGREQVVAVLFMDLRGATAWAEGRLPYDVLFVLNQVFVEMSQALTATGGHYSQFTGDGLMALYGLEGDPAAAARDALRGASAMAARLDAINHRLRGELPQPLRMGVAAHMGDAVVGRMGPPHAQITSAIGDTVNTAARLEGLTKDYDCTFIVSESAAWAAGLTLPNEKKHTVNVKGKKEPITFYALNQMEH